MTSNNYSSLDSDQNHGVDIEIFKKEFCHCRIRIYALILLNCKQKGSSALAKVCALQVLLVNDVLSLVLFICLFAVYNKLLFQQLV